jgi:hypothetical protein
MGGPPSAGKDGKKQSPLMSFVKGSVTGVVEAAICMVFAL